MKKLPLLLFVLLALTCSHNPITDGGNGSEIGNAKVKGKLVNTNGTPAVNATVELYNADYIPSPTLVKPVDTAIRTNANGQYEIPLPDSGIYNLMAETPDNKVAFIDSVLVKDTNSVTVGTDTVKIPGTIKGVTFMPGLDSINQIRVTIYMPGTGYILMPNIGGSFRFAKVPEGKYLVFFNPTDPAYNVKIMWVNVFSGSVTDLDTIILYSKTITGIPVATISVDDTVSIYDSIPAHGSAKDTLGKIVKMEWRIGDSGVFFQTQTGDAYFIAPAQAASIPFVFRVTDNDGNVVTVMKMVTVIKDAPLASISGPSTIPINTNAVFTAQTTQKFGSIVKYRWGSSLAPNFKDSSGSSFTYKIMAETTVVINLEVTDDDGNVGSAAKTVVVTNDKPVITGLRDTAISINDSIVFTVNAADSNGIVQKYCWNFGDGSGKQFDTTNGNMVGHRFPATAMRCSVSVAVADSFGKQGVGRAAVTVAQDVPVIAFLSKDTIVDHGGTVRCSVYVQQLFGTMTVEIDSANSGAYKSLGGIGLSGGKACSFSTGNACSWDSVKIRVTDDDGNVVTKAFKLRIRPRPLTITGIDSTENTITVHFSQTQENDFAQYRIYRNTTAIVDTIGSTNELWASITSGNTVSFATPNPSYTWQPRYYRIYQKDNEGLWSAGSNVVYGNIINSPPATPGIPHPLNNVDSMWSDDILQWSLCSDPNGHEVRYRVLINYNNTGYKEFITNLQDTTVKLSGYDSLSMKWKVIAYDTLGDSSGWSEERTTIIRPVITDIDGNAYHTVTIGTQVWMVGNLKTTRFNDGTAIPLTMGDSAWYADSTAKTPGYCLYNNDSATGSTYGALYNWYAVNTGKLAPNGWHVPTDAEWTVLTSYLGGAIVAGGKLKEDGTTYWTFPNTGADNTSGFSALPGGSRNTGGIFGDVGDGGNWWSSTAYDASNSWYCWIYNNSASVNLYSNSNAHGFSVRCVRDP